MRRVTFNTLLFTALMFSALTRPAMVYAQSSSTQSVAAQAQQPSAKKATEAKTSIRYGITFFIGKNAKTAFDMVNLLPGFIFSIGETSVRGYAAAAGNVLIDGERPSDKRFTLDTVLQQIPADRVEYIEVIAGTRPDLEMLGQTLVANIVLNKSVGNSTIISLSNGFFLDGRNTPSGTAEITRHSRGGQAFSGAVSASQYVELAEGRGPQIRRDINKNVIETVSVDSAAGGLTAYTYGVFSTPAWRGRLSINGSAARTDYAYGERDDPISPAASSTDLHEYLGGPLGGQLLGELGAHFNRSFGEKVVSETVALFEPDHQSYSSQLHSPGTDEVFSERQQGGETLGRTNLRYSVTPKLTSEGSVEVAYNWLSTASGYLYNAIPVPLPNALATVSEIRDQISGHAIWSPLKIIELDFGTSIEDSAIASKADSSQSKTLNYFKPRIALNFTPNSTERLGIRIEHEVGQLDFADFVAVSSLDTGSVRAGNTNIVPQQDWVFEAVNEKHFWSEGDLAFTYRHFLIADAIDRVPIYSPSAPSSVFDAPGNIGSGTEDTAIVSLTLPMEHLKLENGQFKLIATRLWSNVTDPTTGATRPISGLKPLEYSLSFRQDLSRWHSDWGANFLTPCSTSSTVKGCTESQYRFNEIDKYRATPTINLFIEYQPWKGTSFRIEADNVLQQRYDRIVSNYAGPRNDSPLSYQDDRSLTSSASVLFSLRKMF